MPDCGPQGLRFSQRCCGVSGRAGAGGLAPGGVAVRTAGCPNTLGACAAVKPGFSGAAAGSATRPFDFAITAAWAGFCCGGGTGLGGARGTGILMGLTLDPFGPDPLALILGWAFVPLYDRMKVFTMPNRPASQPVRGTLTASATA